MEIQNGSLDIYIYIPKQTRSKAEWVGDMINLCSRGPHQGDVKMVSWLETQDVEARAESVRRGPDLLEGGLVLGSGDMLEDYHER